MIKAIIAGKDSECYLIAGLDLRQQWALRRGDTPQPYTDPRRARPSALGGRLACLYLCVFVIRRNPHEPHCCHHVGQVFAVHKLLNLTIKNNSC